MNYNSLISKNLITLLKKNGVVHIKNETFIYLNLIKDPYQAIYNNNLHFIFSMTFIGFGILDHDIFMSLWKQWYRVQSDGGLLCGTVYNKNKRERTIEGKRERRGCESIMGQQMYRVHRMKRKTSVINF